jgi:hypothetical protein
MMTRYTFAIVFLLCSLMGCTSTSKETSDQKKPSPKRNDQALPFDVFGKWKVARHFEPGISSMDKTQADAWVGREACYDRTAATFGTEACTTANYVVNVVDADKYFLDEFRIEAKSVGIKPGKIHILEVTCNDSDWIAPGSLLIVKNKEQLLTVWDGIFFELVR